MTTINSILNFSEKIGGNGFILKGAFSAAECDELLSSKIRNGFTSANDKYPASYRNNERYWFDNEALASQLFIRMKTLLKSDNEVNASTKNCNSINFRLRFCKYNKGQVFNIHRDGVYHKNKSEKSKMTFLLYLNDDYLGGETNFYNSKNEAIPSFSYKGKKGDLMIFDHHIWHEGSMVTSKEKYILRSDLIFTDLEKSKFHDGYVWDILDYNDSLYTTGRDRKIKQWRYDLTNISEAEVHTASVLCLEDFSGYIYSISRDGNLARLTKNLQLLNKVDSKHSCPLSVLSGNQFLITTGSDGFIRSWTAELHLVGEVLAHDGWCWGVFKRNYEQIISIGSDGFLNLWDLDLKNIHKVDLNHGSLRCCSLHDDSIFIGCENGNILYVCPNTLKIKFVYSHHVGVVRDIIVKNNFLYSCGEDGQLIKVNLSDNSHKTIDKRSDFLSTIALNKNGSLYASGYDGLISCY